MDQLSRLGKDIKDKVTVPSALDAQKFEGDVKLTGHSFFDSVVIAIATIIIGLPAANWFYSIPFKDKVPTIKCFPPGILYNNESAVNESASLADIESLCLYHHTLYASFFPILVTFFGFWIAVLYFIWRNYNSSKFNLFVSLVNRMTLAKDEQTGKYSDKNYDIANQLSKIFSKGNRIYYTYLFVKCIQALSALIAFLVTVFLYVYSFKRSAFLSAFSAAYEVPTFYCNLEQFEFLHNSSFLSPNMQVPCIEFASLTASLILLIDFILLFIVFVVAIMSMFLIHSRDLEYRQAAQFAFHTGMSPRHYFSKWFSPNNVRCDLDFLISLLRRTDSGRADVLWEVQTQIEIELLNERELMITIQNYDRQMENPIFRGLEIRASTQFSDVKDLKWKKLDSALKPTTKYPEYHEPIHLVVPNSFRAAILGYSLITARKVALYISFESTSLAIPLALSRVVGFVVFALKFDPYYENGDDKLPYRIKKWPHNFSQLTFPDTDEIDINDGIKEAKIKNVDFIVLGPTEAKTSRKAKLTEIFEILGRPDTRVLSSSGCHMLVITPAESTNFLKFTFQESWKKNVTLELKDGKNITWPPEQSRTTTNELTELLHCDKPNKSKLKTPDGSFTFDLYHYQVAQR